MKQERDITGRAKRAPRRDGIMTHTVILEAAGRVFAERGYADATSKDICAAAGVNTAAVNYYFGGKDSLYEAVLVEGHRQLLSLEDLGEIMSSGAPPEEKLRAFYERLLRTARAASELWGIKVFLREIAAPSPTVNKALPEVILPKAALLRGLIGEITGHPPDSVTVQRGVAFVVLPAISLIMFPEALRTRILPATAVMDGGMLDDMMRYALGGLRALAVAAES